MSQQAAPHPNGSSALVQGTSSTLLFLWDDLLSAPLPLGRPPQCSSSSGTKKALSHASWELGGPPKPCLCQWAISVPPLPTPPAPTVGSAERGNRDTAAHSPALVFSSTLH
ncbi:unnamed protein product [Gadus morhua 'NCC']